MENFFGILLVIIFLLIVAGPMLRRWFGPMLQRWMLGKFEDRMRRMAGMPTRKEEKRARKKDSRRRHGGAERFRQAAWGSRTRTHESAVDMLRAYAEDVEFTEVKSYSSNVEIAEDPSTHTTSIRVEEQVEDVEFVEFKSSEEKR